MRTTPTHTTRWNIQASSSLLPSYLPELGHHRVCHPDGHVVDAVAMDDVAEVDDAGHRLLAPRSTSGSGTASRGGRGENYVGVIKVGLEDALPEGVGLEEVEGRRRCYMLVLYTVGGR